MDDIFSSASSGGLREKIINLAINDQTDSIIKTFSVEIIKEKLVQKPAYDEFCNEINIILDKM